MSTTKHAKYETEEERLEAKREAVRRYRRKNMREGSGNNEVLHLQAELSRLQSLYQAQSDRLQDFERRFEVLTTHIDSHEGGYVTTEQLKPVLEAIEAKLEARSKLPPRFHS